MVVFRQKDKKTQHRLQAGIRGPEIPILSCALLLEIEKTPVALLLSPREPASMLHIMHE
jgi:hypothetical protein